MSDIVKGVLAGSWAVLVGWILPCSIGLSIFGLVLLPKLDGMAVLNEFREATPGVQAIALVAASVAAGLTLSALQQPLYRVLEGYWPWPDRWQERFRQRQRNRRDRIYNAMNFAKEAGESLREGQLQELFARYPEDVSQVAPTSLGNSIRRLEFYAQNRYKMDSQLLWYQLRAVTPEVLAKEMDNARAVVDFFVCSIYVLLLLGVGSLAAVLAGGTDGTTLVILAVAAVAAAVLSYRSAVSSTDAWASSVRAVVDLGRAPLLKALGLKMPQTLAEERELWQRLGWFLNFPYAEEGAASLDRFRFSPVTEPASDFELVNRSEGRKRRRRHSGSNVSPPT